MAAHIPTVLSLLGTAASAYPTIAAKLAGIQSTQPPPLPPPQAPVAPLQNISNTPAPSAPVSFPGSIPSQSNNGSSSISTSPGNNANPLCDVSILPLDYLFERLTQLQYCHLRPKYSDGVKLHPYCGKTCASKNKLKNWTPAMGNQPPQMAVPGANCDVSSGSSFGSNTSV